MSILILVLGVGIYFEVQYKVEPKNPQPDIVQLMAGDVDEEGPGRENSKSKKFNSRLLIEDDDDSARDLMIVIPILAKVYVLNPAFVNYPYTPYQSEIITPPPKG